MHFTPDDFLDIRNDLCDQIINFDNAFMSFIESITNELCHICLYHILSPGYDNQPLDVSRN
jgi:hypothetical protein